MTWIYIAVIVGLVYVTIAHSALLYDNYLMKQVLDNVPKQPNRYIFFYGKNSTHMHKLIKTSWNTHHKAKVQPLIINEEDGFAYVKFDNDNEIIAIEVDNKKTIQKLTREQIKEYNNKVFVDAYIKAETAFNALGALGLRNYMIEVGFVDEKSV